MHPTSSIIAAALALALAACQPHQENSAATGGGSDHDLEAAEFKKGRIAIPLAVRTNLGMTFARAEARSIRRVLSVPGRLEVEPSARARYTAPAAGRIEVLARELGVVETGDPLFRLTPTGQDALTIAANADGRVLSLLQPSGAWAAKHAPVVDLVDPTQLRFRGRALQSELPLLRDGMSARVFAEGQLESKTEGVLMLGLTGDAAARTLDVFVALEEPPRWARPDIAARIEVTVDETSPLATAVPLRAIRRDGLDRILFRRDPEKPDEVIRVKAVLGLSDGRWIEVLEGVAPGDEVVLDGSFQLLYSGDDKEMEKGGHFHADGTYHAGGH